MVDKIALGADHAGYRLKEEIKVFLSERNYSFEDFGTFNAKPVDYPEIAIKVAISVASGEFSRGILFCGTGIGMSIVANKVPGVYASLCHDIFTARASRAHNNANILALGGRILAPELAKEIVREWLETPFEGGRHLRRIQQIKSFEEKVFKKEKVKSSNLIIVDHPLIQHKLSILRDKNTGVKEFRELISEVSALMLFEVTRDLPLLEKEIETPISKAKALIVSGKEMVLVPILRAGLGMVDGILKLMPTAKVGHIGLYRDPKTLEPVTYYCKLPQDTSERDVVILDPMLATGGSAVEAVKLVKEYKPKSIKFLCIIAAPEGVERLQRAHPDVEILTAALDERINDHGYIVPGLGDAGDRIFGTK
ncbi:MAG: uracil phosphoribosyltransferase [Synergistetes bacterium]|nr:uracil phosphoribosyltransferase [Synergistota bacterium]MCX8127930.1 uracil phosphoribosyltransferase [Synergistota bacterium]MDW8192029.1 uracil phosphoribosyltransferase [Synergistota bacterium]